MKVTVIPQHHRVPLPLQIPAPFRPLCPYIADRFAQRAGGASRGRRDLRIAPDAAAPPRGVRLTHSEAQGRRGAARARASSADAIAVEI